MSGQNKSPNELTSFSTKKKKKKKKKKKRRKAKGRKV